ncbi:MAG: bile acid:sodium symporter family protein [Granulosicoccaceae bacterium]
MIDIDSAVINFSQTSLMVLNASLGVVMFGVALDLKIVDFRRLLQTPKPVLVGVFSQFVALPCLTFVLVWLSAPQASIALGLILIAACPGGNVSNFFSHRAAGNTALSVSLTSLATVLAVVMTPLNLSFWGSLYPPSAELVLNTRLDPVQMALTLLILLILPMAAGIALNERQHALAVKLKRPIQSFSLVFFGVFVLAALLGNWQNFKSYVSLVFVLVLAHNLLALITGLSLAKLAGLSRTDQRTVTLETGIQNSGLGLVLIFSFFDGLGGMAVIAAWWGIWHIIAGFTAAQLFRASDGRPA